MADNTVLNTGTGGDTIASDDIAGVKYQRVKLVHGADGVNAGDVATANPLPVGDAGGTLTVDAPVGTPVFVRLSDGSAAIATLPVSVASVPSHAVTNAGTFAVQVDGAALTALQLIDDTVFTDDATFTPGTSKVSATGFLADETAADSVDEGDIGIGRMTLDRKQHVSAELESGSVRDAGTARTPKFAVISGSTSGNNTLVAAVASRKIRVISFFLVADGTVNVKFQSGAGGTDLTGAMALIANTGMAVNLNQFGHFETAVNTLLNMNLSAAVGVRGALTYIEVA